MTSRDGIESLLDIESLLRQAIGLDVQTVGRHVVEAAVRATMEASGAPTVDEYAPMLRDARELERLIDAVAVPESSFFRDPGSFEYLRAFVAREWQSSSVLRVLSIPCAAGEEPYSIAMTLVDAGLAPARFSIDAVDIRASAVAAARRGIFRPGAFRNDAALAARERHFTPHANGFALSDSVRELVRFRCANLLDPSLLAGETFDVVFCKNLLIYFTEDARCRAVGQLQRLMTTEGRLFAGASEIVWLQSAGGFTGVGGSAAMALRRRIARVRSLRRSARGVASSELRVARASGRHAAALAPRTPQLATAAPLAEAGALASSELRVARASARHAAAPAPRNPHPATAASLAEAEALASSELRVARPSGRHAAALATRNPQLATAASLAEARALAGSGKLGEAAEIANVWLRAHGPSDEVYVILGLVAFARRNDLEGRLFMERALYLNPDNVEALTFIALERERDGDDATAALLRERARRAEASHA